MGQRSDWILMIDEALAGFVCDPLSWQARLNSCTQMDMGSTTGIDRINIHCP